MEYWRLLDLVRLVFEGNWQILTPTFRSNFFLSYLNALEQWPPTDEFASHTHDHILSNLGAICSDEVSELFSIGFSKETVLDTLRGRHFVTEPILYLLIMQHIAHIGRAPSAVVKLNLNSSEVAFADAVQDGFTSSWRPFSLEPFALPECKHADLVRALAMSGMPVGFANELANGERTWKTISTSGFANKQRNRIYALLPWFEAYAATVRQKGREQTARQAPSTCQAAFRKIFEQKKKRYRSVCLKFLNNTDAPTRTKFLAAHQTAYTWLLVNDQRWLNAQLPRLRKLKNAVTSLGTIEAARRRVLAHLEKYPEATRTQLFRRASIRFAWSRAHDFDWLESVLPKPRYPGPR